MSDDLKERLKNPKSIIGTYDRKAMSEGADNIATLEAENKRLRDMLSKILAVPIGYHAASQMEGIAREALMSGVRCKGGKR